MSPPSDGRTDPIVDLATPEERERAIPALKESFTGIYRWHAKRTLRTVPSVRALLQGAEVAGAALLDRLAPEVGYVYYIFVRAAYRGHGIGGRLLDDALGRFRTDGAEVVYAAVEEDNAASLALFASRGFRLVARDEPNYREGGLGAQGLRSRMVIVYGEVLLGMRLPPPGGDRNSRPLGAT